MSDTVQGHCRYFLTYSGVKLPLKLLTELEPGQLENRNTYFCGYFDEQDRLVGLRKLVYGEVEMEHRYTYHPGGALRSVAIIDAEGDCNGLEFDENGEVLAGR